jgi:hypothetical protein
MPADYLQTVARWLNEQPGDRHQFAMLAELADPTAVSRQVEMEAIRTAAERLDALGLVGFHHHVAMPMLAVLHRDGLRRIAAGEALVAVAQDVECERPLTIVRTCYGDYAAWYLSPLRLPAGADKGVGGALGSTPEDAFAVLRARARAAGGLNPLPLRSNR